jgi:membrane dipeptidase
MSDPRAISFDLHADTLMAIAHERHRLDGTTPTLGQVDARRMRLGGLDAQFFAIFVTPYWTGESARDRAHALIDAFERELAREPVPQLIALARTIHETEELVGAGRLAALYGIEGGHVLAGRLSTLEEFAVRGVRYLTLTWANANELADSSGSPPVHGGLSTLGREAIAALESLGMLVDVAHIADSSIRDVLNVARTPVFSSHSCCRALDAHPRNLTDEQLRGIAATGGVIGIAFHSAFMLPPRPIGGPQPRWRSSGPWRDPLEEEQADRRAPVSDTTRARLDRLVEHFLHALEVAGPEHVALGSDFDGRILPPADLPDVSALPQLRNALRARGVSEEVLAAIWGGNVRRILLDADKRRAAAGL